MNEVVCNLKRLEESIEIMEFHYLDERAKRVEENVWLELTLELVKSRRASRNEAVICRKVRNDQCIQVSELAHIRRGSNHSSDVITKSTAVVRGREAFILVRRNAAKSCRLSIQR